MFHFTARIAVIGHATIAPLRSFHVAPVDGTPGTCPPFRTARFFSMYSYASRLKEESATSCQPSSARSTISTLPTSIERLIRVSLLGQVYSVGRAIEEILDRPHAIEDAPKRIPASAPIRESEPSYSLPSQRHRPMPPSFRPPAGDRHRHGVASTMNLTHRPRAFGSPLITKGAQDPTRGSGRLPADRDSLFRRAFRPLSALYFRSIKDEGHPRSKGRKPATSWRSRSVTQANS